MSQQPSISIDDTLVNMEGLTGNQTIEEIFDVDQLTINSQDIQRSTTPLSTASMDSCHNHEEAVEKGHLDVVVKKVPVARALSSVDSGMPEYKMTAFPRGLALIIEIEEYDNAVQTKRIGSDVDVANLKKLFQQLHFKSEHLRNLTRLDMLKALKDFAAHPDHRDADMMVLVILSHGTDGRIITTDGRQFETEAIYLEFNNTNCPLLRGKPKFFIIQACRGDTTDSVTDRLGDGDDEFFNEKVPSRKRRIGTDYDTVPMISYQMGELNSARPTWEDMIIAYSTIPGFTSQRDHNHGTWFIQALVETFMNHAHEKELIDLLRMTSDYLSRFTNDKGEKQTCNVEMRHLYKRIYFNPGFPRDRRVSGPNMSPVTLRRSLSTPPSSPRRRPDSYYHDDE